MSGRGVLRAVIESLIEGRRRKAEAFVARYLAEHGVGSRRPPRLG